MKFQLKYIVFSVFILLTNCVIGQEIDDKIKSIREMDSLYRSVSGSYPNSEFEFNYEDGYFYIYLPSVIIIDSMYVSNKNRHRTIDKNIIFHKDSIDSFNFDVLSKKYKINVASIQNLSKIMIAHKVKTICSLL